MRNYYLLVALLLSCYFSAISQELKFEHYDDTDGLSHNSVRHIVQDDRGFLWLGTFGGLNRFDGYQFKSYLSAAINNGAMFNDDITALEFHEPTHHLWIGTRRGLTLYNTETHIFKTFLPGDSANSLPDEEIRSVHVDKFEQVWVGTKTKGLYVLNVENETFTKVLIPNFEYIKVIYEDSIGTIWIGSFGEAAIAKIQLDAQGNISKLNTYELHVSNSDVKNPYLNFIYEDAKSSIFAGTREGLFKLNISKDGFEEIALKDETVKESLGPHFNAVTKAPDGKYWVGTLGGLLVCDSLEGIATGNFDWHYAMLSDNSSLIDNLIYSLYFDKSGVLWIGTEDGLDKYDPFENQFNLNKDISKYIADKAPKIRGFAKTLRNEIIVATWHNGLFITKNKHIVPLKKGIPKIASIYSQDGKTFYSGSWNGDILVYDYLLNSYKVVAGGFENVPITDFELFGDTLLVSSFGKGAKFFNTNTMKVFESSTDLLPNYDINKMKRIGNEIWFATETGAVKYHLSTGEIKKYTSEAHGTIGLPHENVSDILIDHKNNVWAATRNGIAKYDAIKDNFMTVEVPNGLQGKWVIDMVLDGNHNIWFNMNNNTIASYDTEMNTAKIYHVLSGNRLDVFSSSGFLNFNDSLIYVGAKEGVISFSPHLIKENEISPKPIITEFKVQNKEVLPNDTINDQVIFERGINYHRKALLDYSNRNFSIQFSTPSYTNPSLNKFKYKLEGFDEDWIETSSDSRTVQYTNLFAGEYTFKLQSANSDGNWSEEAAYAITVLPTFWNSFQGIVLIIFTIVLMFYLLRKQLKFRIKLKQELLTEKVKRERDEKLNNEKLRFFTNISHELRTPLTLILGPTKQLLEQEKENTYTRSRIDLIYQNANRLLRLVNQILDFRRAETGELKLKVSQNDILISTKNIFSSFIELADSKNITFNLHVDETSLECWIDKDKYNKILFNLLSNAMKFTNAYGTVDLFIGFQGEEKNNLVIEVSDDGIGIPLESQEKIFSRFYQANNSKESTTGTGIGLSFVKALVTLHKGEIKVESEPNVGSTFTVLLPVFKEAFDPEEIFTFVEEKEPTETLISVSQIEASLQGNAPKKAKTNTDVKQTILIVDDNSELRKYVVEYLSDFYKVFEAENGEEALTICKKEKPVLCVADVMMPVMDGFQFVEVLKNDDNLSHIAVILLTALAENENRMKGYQIGVDGYLVKPFDPALLKTRIDNIIKIHADLKQKFSGDEESDALTLAHSPLDVDLISKVKEFIEVHIADPNLTSNILSDELGMSSSKLYRKITQLTDMSPNEFIRTIRLKKSAQLLKTKKYNVSEVADQVGFNDPLYFSRCFKKQFGKSPSSLLK
ncbi:Two component regulator propeller [Pustulibacterium marinum]|uniref:histidine kinase n=1 Tax=Pustulibacterium marinum TaxID=1224947 RepID=A0A1I7IAE0_9FLAO|nr:hybrid sensor histidine kinase/response regulator transcription factor [Pustulibacterium marinum]SFU69878.1 Two component regulator propeller [Pustulibacterium marinum]